ncbi:hypothetical protein Glove_551g61 [Diversispora epigaea]|uniref:Uncharacterized protein n=1 Tax=Diversispora epigaea TaxID=1348612 RepID=A0A397GEB4_9GLOM|nr:hypothetical protein Glove_551g61 [Diversispora epigaea]
MSNESDINYLISSIDSIDSIDYTFQSQFSFDSGTSLYHRITTSFTIHEQEIQIKFSTSSNVHAKSKVWDYFTKPYGNNIEQYKFKSNEKIIITSRRSNFSPYSESSFFF